MKDGHLGSARGGGQDKWVAAATGAIAATACWNHWKYCSRFANLRQAILKQPPLRRALVIGRSRSVSFAWALEGDGGDDSEEEREELDDDDDHNDRRQHQYFCDHSLAERLACLERASSASEGHVRSLLGPRGPLLQRSSGTHGRSWVSFLQLWGPSEASLENILKQPFLEPAALAKCSEDREQGASCKPLEATVGHS